MSNAGYELAMSELDRLQNRKMATRAADTQAGVVGQESAPSPSHITATASSLISALGAGPAGGDGRVAAARIGLGGGDPTPCEPFLD